jgi:hypothetical protein
VGVLGGVGVTNDPYYGINYGRADSRFVVGFTGGLGLYVGPNWGFMLASTANVSYPTVYTASPQVFINARHWYGAVGFSWGSYDLPHGDGGFYSSFDNGVGAEGLFLWKLTPFFGAGVQWVSLYSGNPSQTNYFSGQAALQFVY